MGCGGDTCSSTRAFLFINIAFAMYSGALLATAARLAWDPSTYAWFRALLPPQYRASCAALSAAGAALAALVYLAAAAARLAPPPPLPPRARRSVAACLTLYMCGVAVLVLGEVCYGAWMVTSLVAWWRTAPQAEHVRRGLDLLHDLKPALLAVERYRDVARPLYDMLQEIEHQAPYNVYVVVVFALLSVVLQQDETGGRVRVGRGAAGWDAVTAQLAERLAERPPPSAPPALLLLRAEL